MDNITFMIIVGAGSMFSGYALLRFLTQRTKKESAVEKARGELYLELDQLTYNACRHFDNLHDVWDHVFSMIHVNHGTKEYDEAKARCETLARSYGIH